MIKNVLLSIVSLVTLLACGSDNPTNTFVGKFSDSPVAGLTYTTVTQTGTTNAQGEFSYLAGETITFSVGNITLGESVPAKPLITPLDIVPNGKIYRSLNEIPILNHDLASLISSPYLLIPTENIATRKAREAFIISTNILVFLQSIDADRNPDNGIVITQEVAAFFESIELDLAKPFNQFASTLIELTINAKLAGLMENSSIIKPHIALENFYRSQNITHQFSSLGSRKEDIDADGNIDKITTYAYDEQYNTISRIFDLDADGFPNARIDYTYDEIGKELKNITDFQMDGNPDMILTHNYDEKNRKTVTTGDYTGDGIADELTTYSYGYD